MRLHAILMAASSLTCRCLLCVQGLVYRNEFNSAYDIGLRMPTQWCDSSTSHAVTQSLHKVWGDTSMWYKSV